MSLQRTSVVVVWVVLSAFTAFEGTSTAARENVWAKLRICGAGACATVKIADASLDPAFASRGSSPLPPPAGAFYVLELRVEGAPHVQKGWYVPGSHTTRWLFRQPSDWTRLGRRGVAFFHHHLPAGRPFSVPRPVRVSVAHRAVRDISPYVHVYDRFPQAPLPGPSERWVSIRVVWPGGTPWRYEHAELLAVTAKRVLARPGGWFRIPRAFAEAIAHDAS